MNWKYLINGVLFGFVYEGWWHFYQKGVFFDMNWKYLINGVLFGFVYEGWWHFYQKGVFSKEKILSLADEPTL